MEAATTKLPTPQFPRDRSRLVSLHDKLKAAKFYNKYGERDGENNFETEMAQQQHKYMQFQVGCDLEKRVEDLERSHMELLEDVETLARIQQQIVKKPNPFLKILQLMGHAVFLFAPSSREISFWNQSAEALYGWKDYEVLGKDFFELLVDKSEYNVAKEILRRLCMGLPWAGLFPLKKKSGGIIMAMVSDTPLCENGVVVGVISVSSDAFAFRNANNIIVSGYNPCGKQKLGYRTEMLRGLNKHKVEKKQPLHKTSAILKMGTNNYQNLIIKIQRQSLFLKAKKGKKNVIMLEYRGGKS